MAPPYESCNFFSYFFKASTYMYPKLNYRSFKPTLQGVIKPIINHLETVLFSLHKTFLKQFQKGSKMVSCKGMKNLLKTIGKWSFIGSQKVSSRFLVRGKNLLETNQKPVQNCLRKVFHDLNKTASKWFIIGFFPVQETFKKPFENLFITVCQWFLLGFHTLIRNH